MVDACVEAGVPRQSCGVEPCISKILETPSLPFHLLAKIFSLVNFIRTFSRTCICGSCLWVLRGILGHEQLELSLDLVVHPLLHLLLVPNLPRLLDPGVLLRPRYSTDMLVESVVGLLSRLNKLLGKTPVVHGLLGSLSNIVDVLGFLRHLLIHIELVLVFSVDLPLPDLLNLHRLLN